MRNVLRLFLYIVLIINISVLSVFSENTDQGILKVKSESLSTLIESMEFITDEMVTAQIKLSSPEGLGREVVLKEKIERLGRKLVELQESFDLLATGVNIEKRGGLQSGFNWSHELKVLLGPLIQELQDLTLRPREIEKLRSKIAFYKEHILLADTALKNLEGLIAHKKNSDKLRARLGYAVNSWRNNKNEWESLNNIVVMQLEMKQRDTSITKSLQDIPRIFFKSHGRNMVIAFIVFIIVCLAMFRLHGLIEKYSPIHADQRSFYGRMFDLGYIFIAMVFALISTLSVLYLFSDWVLLSVALIFILGFAWASKQAFPKMWIQVKLILNLGPVKEGEVVVFKALPYRVLSINLYTKLYNPLVQGGLLRVPISDIVDLRSRPSIEDEPWFPTSVGDWILFEGKSCGQIITQTPESVKIKIIGGMEIFYPTIEYLKLPVMNLSSGFRLWLCFGLDYRYQNEITERIPKILETGIAEGLVAAGFNSITTGVNVRFKAAAQSSLDLEIMADFNEAAGEYYFTLDRIIQKACVDVCNNRGWSIPFMQMTVHMANSSEPS